MTAPAGAPPPDWQLGPGNRWAYQHVGELVPTQAVPRGIGPAGPPPRRAAPTALEDLTGDDTLDAAWIDGIAVLHDGAIVLERYRNGMGPASLHLSQSVGKSVLGLVVGALAARGVLDLAAPVTELVPEVAGSGYAGATVQHLLDMTAAIDFVEDYEAGFWRYDVACGWHAPAPGAEHDSILGFLESIGPAAHRHGEVLHYATPNTDLLGIAAERAAGAPLAALTGFLLWAPMGAEHDAELTVDPAGTAAIGGGLCASLRDYLRVGALVLDGGVAQGRRVVPAAYVDALGVGDPGAFARRTDRDGSPGATGYGRQWWRAGDQVVARGIHGQRIVVDRDARLVVAVLSSWPDAMVPAADAGQRELVGALRERLAGPPATP